MIRSIIRSILDTDLYKITMGQAIFNRYPRIGAVYQFVNRGKTPFPTNFKDKLKGEIESMANLKLTKEEQSFLENIRFLKPTFVDWFSHYRFKPEEVKINQNDNELNLRIEGPWYRTIYWEVPLLALISELYFMETGQKPDEEYLIQNTELKGETLRDNQARIADFGTRRRFSFDVQETVLNILIRTMGKAKEGGFLNGTSNVYLALKLDLTLIGTFAHEWVQGHSAIFGYERATPEALKVWSEEFEAVLGIALSDTYTTDEFLSHFNHYFAKLFDGVRQDSGKPLEALEKVIKHYKKLGINPTTKTFVASDNLNVDKILEIKKACRDRISCSFGVGTNLTNDVSSNVKPLNMVIKLWQIIFPDGRLKNVVKLSDDKGKITGDHREAEIAQYILFGKT